MENKVDDNSKYCEELTRKLDEVIAWSVLNCPVREANLRYADFESIRNDFFKLASGKFTSDNEQNHAEPEDGGPQYINDNPAPWP